MENESGTKKKNKLNFYERAHKNLSKLLKKLFRITVVGAENEPVEGGVIAIANHISFLDVIVMAVALRRQIRFMAKKELFSIPLLGKLITSLGAFPVDRAGSVAGSMKKAINLLKEGDIVGMYPTGHRYRGVPVSETLERVKGGVGMAAFHSGASILPMYIMTKNNRVRLFRPITIYVGKVIPFGELGFDKGGTAEYEAAAKTAFRQVIALSENADLANLHKDFSRENADSTGREGEK